MLLLFKKSQLIKVRRRKAGNLRKKNGPIESEGAMHQAPSQNNHDGVVINLEKRQRLSFEGQNKGIQHLESQIKFPKFEDKKKGETEEEEKKR